MKTILVDDEPLMLEQFRIECSDIGNIEMVGMFKSSEEALDFARDHHIELALLDVEMPGMNGLDLCTELKKLYPDIVVVFVSAYDEYIKDAILERGADYYVTKPYTKQDMENVLQRALLLSKRFEKRVRIETFGRFTVYVDNDPIVFAGKKAKELLALMVDRRGKPISNQEAFYEMWEGREFNHDTAVQLHKALRKLKDALEAVGVTDLIEDVSKTEHRVNPDMFDCDLYRFLDGDPETRASYDGNYMNEWTWGEATAALLTRESLRDKRA